MPKTRLLFFKSFVVDDDDAAAAVPVGVAVTVATIAVSFPVSLESFPVVLVAKRPVAKLVATY